MSEQDKKTEQSQEPAKLASWVEQPEITEKPIYNYAGAIADIAAHIEGELNNSCLENYRPWKSIINKDVKTGTITFTNVTVPKFSEEFNLAVEIRINKDETDKENPFCFMELDVLVNGQVFGAFRHVTGVDVYDHALNRFNNQYNCIN